MPGKYHFSLIIFEFVLHNILFWQPRPLGQLFFLATPTPGAAISTICHTKFIFPLSLLTVFVATRSGKEFRGLSKEQTLQQLEEYETLALSNFDTASLIRSVQPLQVQFQECEEEPPLREYTPRPLVDAGRSYTITPIADLASFRPKVRASTPRKRQVKPYSKPEGQSARKLSKKRQGERALRAENRRKEQEKLGTNVKAHQRVHVQKTQGEFVRTDVDASDVVAEASIWSGPRDEVPREEMSFDEVKSLPGMQVITFDGRCVFYLSFVISATYN